MAFDLASRKKIFLKNFLNDLIQPIGFADIGSGGELKEPWSLFDEKNLQNHNFEPTAQTDNFLCVSDKVGTASFYVAIDERGSSLHKPLKYFADRLGQETILTKKEIQVSTTTLDNYFEGKYDRIDCLDINVEGHDYQVLTGAEKILDTHEVKLIKIEFETAAVWQGQGWFGDIDTYARSKGYELADIELEYAPTKSSSHIFYRGEPLWGKAYYVPCINILEKKSKDREYYKKAIALYIAANLVGRAMDVIELNSDSMEIKQKVAHLYKYAPYEKLFTIFKGIGVDAKRRILG